MVLVKYRIGIFLPCKLYRQIYFKLKKGYRETSVFATAPEIHLVAGLDEAKPKSRNEVTAIAFMEAALTKRRLGVKVLRRFMTIKKAEIFYDIGCYIHLVAVM